MTTKQYAVINGNYKPIRNRDSFLFTEEEALRFEGGEEIVVEVRCINVEHLHYTLTLTQYYSSDGVFKLECTNTLEVALKILAAALREDAKLN